MRATIMNAGMVLSIGVFFSLMVAGLARSLPQTMQTGLTAQGVPVAAAHAAASVPPVGTLFAAFLGYNPIEQLLGPGIVGALPPGNAATLTGRHFFPNLISAPFHDGLTIVFSLAIAMGLVAAGASLLRGRQLKAAGRHRRTGAVGQAAVCGSPPKSSRHRRPAEVRRTASSWRATRPSRASRPAA
jgi:hypothetical protein